MTLSSLSPRDLGVAIAPESLGFTDTTELLHLPLPWIGQARAQTAARFGLTMAQPDYNLFVLGEVGSGRSSLMQSLMKEVAATQAIAPDLCYLHNFDAPEKPRALRMPAGQGRLLRQHMLQLCKNLQKEIPLRLEAADFKAESASIEKRWKDQDTQAFDALSAFAEQRHFALYRDEGHLVLTLIGENGAALTESEARSLPKERRAEIDNAEDALHEEMSRYLEHMRPLEKAMGEAVLALRRKLVKPVLEHEMQGIREGVKRQIKDAVKLGSYLDQVTQDVLDNLDAFLPSDTDEMARLESLLLVLSRYRVNLAVDNAEWVGAPVVIEENPSFHSLFGSIEYRAQEDALQTDFSRVRAGSLFKAHGGFILLHLRDVVTDALVWEKLRRFVRSGRLQIEEPGAMFTPIAAVSLAPEAVDVDVKIVLIGSSEQYYDLQEADPDFSRRFRVKVDFAESFMTDATSYHACAVYVAHLCQRMGLTHFSAPAVVRLLEASHRAVDDQTRMSAIFSQMEAAVMESAAQCRGRGGKRVEPDDVVAALLARRHRHDYPDQRLQETITDGDRLITLHGDKVGQINALTQIDQGDYRFGFPVRLTARTYAGNEGLLNIEREVEMSGPIHDKGVLILHSYLSALFAHMAPLALNASIVFEQEYHGVEGDSASCAELYALLSSLSGLPLRQGIAVTGALNQHGEVLPVGGINEKIEGYFRICETAGLDGRQGVLIPHRNRRHLMLAPQVVKAVADGQFHIYTVEHVGEGMALLTGFPSGMPGGGARGYDADSVLGSAQKALQAYRRACQLADEPKMQRRRQHH